MVLNRLQHCDFEERKRAKEKILPILELKIRNLINSVLIIPRLNVTFFAACDDREGLASDQDNSINEVKPKVPHGYCGSLDFVSVLIFSILDH